MNRKEMAERLNRDILWDLIVIGGGASGLGVAVDAAARGYQTLLLEQHDFAKATSSKSTKLIHGGVRYLQQGNVNLVLEALKERGLLMKNAPHLISNLSFIVPNYKWWDGPFYGIGLKVYDAMAGNLGLGKSQWLSKEKTVEYLPNLETEGLKGGVIYHDGQFDDARLAISLALTAADHGACLLNYVKVDSLLKNNGMICGVRAFDQLGSDCWDIRAKAVINATGIFTEDILAMDQDRVHGLMALSQGIHIVLDKHFLAGEHAIMVPHTDDGRVLFAVPWHDKVLLGTTETPVPEPELEPVPQDQEIEFLLHHAARYLREDPSRADIRSLFAGIRPLVKSDPQDTRSTAAISREHTLMVSASGLITITGGKWTIYRKMAEDTVDKAIQVANLDPVPCGTEHLPLHGFAEETDWSQPLHFYGSDAAAIQKLSRQNAELSQRIHPSLAYTRAEVLWAIRQEMAMTLEDVLARRTRSLFLDAAAAMEAATDVAELMRSEWEYSLSWKQKQLDQFENMARNFIPQSG